MRGPSKRAQHASMESGIERIAEMQERRLAQEEVNRRQEKREDYQRQEQQRADDREGKEWKTSRGNRLLHWKILRCSKADGEVQNQK